MSRDIVVNLNFDPSVIGTKKETQGTVKGIFHYGGGGEEGTTYCGQHYKIREFPDKRQTTLFTIIPEYVSCTKCQRKLKEEAITAKNLRGYIKKIEPEIDDSKGEWAVGYIEAIYNLCGEFNNGVCADCPFCFETSGYDFESGQPEAILHCSLETCWIDEVKEIIRRTKHGKTKIKKSKKN